MSGASPLWQDPDPEPWETEGDVAFLATEEGWRGTLHPEADEPGWPEPEGPGEYGLYRRDAEEGE